jgi:hypothetical protein
MFEELVRCEGDGLEGADGFARFVDDSELDGVRFFGDAIGHVEQFDFQGVADGQDLTGGKDEVGDGCVVIGHGRGRLLTNLAHVVADESACCWCCC